MSAAAQSKMVMSSSEFASGLDLNLSLHSINPSLPEPDSFHPNPDANPTPVISFDRQIVDLTLTKAIISGEIEDGGSQNSTLSTLTRKRNHPEEELHPVPGREASPPLDEEDGENSRKKLRLSREQSLLLEDTFKDHNTLNPRQKLALAKQLGLSARQVEVWFQNRRARTKLKQTEAECEYMKRNCESLMDRLRRLQKEVTELRALKLAPQFYMQMPPSTTLTLCPSCERVGIPTPAGGPVNAGRVGVDCNMGRVGPISGNLWAASSNHSHRPF
ncbi:unnamed protein product [Rhodiola kirilowii]